MDNISNLFNFFWLRDDLNLFLIYLRNENDLSLKQLITGIVKNICNMFLYFEMYKKFA